MAKCGPNFVSLVDCCNVKSVHVLTGADTCTLCETEEPEEDSGFTIVCAADLDDRIRN